MQTKRLLTTALLMGLVSTPLYAGHGQAEYYDAGDVFYDKARVIDVKPLMEVVQVPVSSRECWTDEVEYPGRRSNPNAGMVAGGIIGGVLGHTLGKGHRDRGVATVAGTILGGAIGRDVARRQETAPYVSQERTCRTSHKYYEEERLAGYRVTYRYRGRTFTREMAEDPGKFVQIRVALEPMD
jgi:uncharacterized protein YcfJ